MRGKLLDDIALESQILISSLKELSASPKFLMLLLDLNLTQYSLEECSYSLSYIFEQPLSFQNYGEITAFLKQRLADSESPAIL
ncbi:MAG TPA: hypothetical protein IAB57_04335 [Candidatus Fimivivens faecavium]|nr:hypothetical protein [Candidatus Fimivivens faecavium]